MSHVAPKFEAPLLLGAQIEARADHPDLANDPFLLQGDRVWTWRRFRDESVRTAHFLLGRIGTIDERRPGHVAMLLENHFELLSLLGACGYAGLTLFGVNHGLRGETLAEITRPRANGSGSVSGLSGPDGSLAEDAFVGLGLQPAPGEALFDGPQILRDLGSRIRGLF